MDAIKNSSNLRKPIVSILAATFFILGGCRYINPQEDVESKFAQDQIKCMTIHEISSTNIPVTNITQLFLAGYPHVAHEKLLRFGKHAGFKTSLVEKYIFFWPRLKHPNLFGEVICMNAHPFPDTDGRLGRFYISNTGKRELARGSQDPGSNVLVNAYSYTFISEDRLQRVFQDVKPSIAPLPPIQAPPTPSPEVQQLLDRSLPRRYYEFTRNVAGAFSQDARSVDIVLKLVAIIVISALTFFCVFFIRRGRRAQTETQHRPPET